MPSETDLLDARARPLRDLRISVTDRCNFRCRYCLPRENFSEMQFLPRRQILSFEEITRLATLLREAGLEKIRITGGEPLLRRGLERLVQSLCALEVDLALTTNGVLLPRHAPALREAGLRRLTVSLDAIDESTFQAMCDSPGWGAEDVLAGVEAAERAGFERVKLNCVVRRGVNEDEIVRLARHFLGTRHVVRFIEFMDVGNVNGWQRPQVVSSREIRERLREVGQLEPLAPTRMGEVARRYRLTAPDGKKLEVGIIASVTQPFCSSCTRLRLAADGRLFTCLFASQGHDLKVRLRSDATDAQIMAWLTELWAHRRDRYSEERPWENARKEGPHRLPVIAPRAEMSYIGG